LNNERLPTNVDVGGTLNANGTVTFSGNVTMTNSKILTLSNTGVGTQYIDTLNNNSLRLWSYGPNNGGVISFQANATTVGSFGRDGLTVTGNAGVSKTVTAAAFSGPSLTAAAATALVLGAGGSERVRIDANGNVGIGNAAPVHTLAVNGTGYVSGQLIASNLSVTGATTYLNATGLSVVTPNPDGTQYGMIGVLQRGGAGNVGLTLAQTGVSAFGILHPNGGGLTFVDNRYPSNLGGGGSGATGTERLRIDTSGRLGVGNSAPAHQLSVNGTSYLNGAVTATSTLAVAGAATFANDVVLTNPSTGYITRNAAVVGAGGMRIEFVRTGGGSLHSVAFTSNVVTCSGELYSTGNVRVGSTTAAPFQLDLTADTARKLTTTTWATGSDARVKSNVQFANLDMCYDVVKAVPLRRFEWDAAQYPDIEDRSVVGWIAQEVEAVFPKAVSSSSERGFDDFRTLSSDQIYKTMYGALQRVIADKEALEARVALLEVMRQP
jgi:hypothetical protein